MTVSIIGLVVLLALALAGVPLGFAFFLIGIAGFASVCGSSLATAATMAKVAMPSMRKYRYADSLSSGSIAAGGTLGILIPPSVPMVIYGLLAEADIGKLFIAGIIPSILLTLLFILAIAIQVQMNPALGPPGERSSWPDRMRALSRIWGIAVLFVIIIGGIYVGVFTPTEAAGVGAAGAFLFAITHGKVRMAGMFDSLAMILLTIPIFVPILTPFGIDLIWFGIIVIIVVELGLITPPIGMNVFVVQSTIGDVSVWTVFRGVWPFIFAMFAGLALILVFPQIALWLTTLM